MNNEMVKVDGTASEAMAGAVIITPNRVIYVHGLAGWPAALIGRKITVTGRLAEEQHIPVATVAADGARSAGSTGKQWVMRDATWEPAG